MTNQHTRGPWHIAKRGDQATITAESREGKVDIAVVEVGFVGQIEVEQQANARLIIASPDMIAALDEAPIPSKYHGMQGFDVDQFLADYAVFFAMRRTALAKARGGIAP